MSSGSEPKVSFKALFISVAVPSKEAATAADEKSVASEDYSVITVFEEEADAILSMAGCMKSTDSDSVADFECRAMFWCFRNFRTISAANDWDLVMFELCSQRFDILDRLIILTNSTLPPAWSWWLYGIRLQ